MKYSYKTENTCSKQIDFEIENGCLKNVCFYGGCNGNLKAISSLVEGMPIEKVLASCTGIHCGDKTTSCSDQLCRAILQAIKEK